MPRIVRSRAAKRDLRSIWNYIAKDSLTAANGLLRRIDDRMKEVAEVPALGQSREDLAPGLRSIRVGNYLLFYRILNDEIEFIRVLHGARDLYRIFRSSPD